MGSESQVSHKGYKFFVKFRNLGTDCSADVSSLVIAQEQVYGQLEQHPILNSSTSIRIGIDYRTASNDVQIAVLFKKSNSNIYSKKVDLPNKAGFITLEIFLTEALEVGTDYKINVYVVRYSFHSFHFSADCVFF